MTSVGWVAITLRVETAISHKLHKSGLRPATSRRRPATPQVVDTSVASPTGVILPPIHRVLPRDRQAVGKGRSSAMAWRICSRSGPPHPGAITFTPASRDSPARPKLPAENRIPAGGRLYRPLEIRMFHPRAFRGPGLVCPHRHRVPRVPIPYIVPTPVAE